MKQLIVAFVLCAFSVLTCAQSNPVTAAARDALQRRQKNLVEAAQEIQTDAGADVVCAPGRPYYAFQ
jgi:hypothetical protein